MMRDLIKDEECPIQSPPWHTREAGILLAVTSLPSRYGIGDLGPEAYRFIDQLHSAGQKLWQILPVNPTSFGNSPYQSPSAFAGNPYMISPELLIRDGLLAEGEPERFDFGEAPADIDYGKIYLQRPRMLRLAYGRWRQRGEPEKKSGDWLRFIRQNSGWLEEYAFFMALKDYFKGRQWNQWEASIRDRCPEAVSRYRRLLKDDILFWKFCQYQFFRQWSMLREYALKKEVRLVGDIPFYIAFDSADVWAGRDRFLLTEDGLDILLSAGVPADGVFGETRNWGNPIYDWKRMEEDGFQWWEERIRGCGRLFDVLRIDHVIALVRFYGIPMQGGKGEPGQPACWYLGPDAKETKAAKVIDRTAKECGMEIIAEDLGMVNDRVRMLLREMGWSGMRVLQYAFFGKYGAKNNHLPFHHTPEMVVYTETHDNETLAGFLESKTEGELQYIKRYLKVSDRYELPWAVIEEAYRSAASKAVIPMQDVLGLDNRAQLCDRGDYSRSWRWRMLPDQFTREMQLRLRKLAELFGR